MTSVQNKGETLMGDAEKARSTSDAAAGVFEGFANQAAFVAEHFGVEREAWWH